jgi:S1-C subfamily serine protease
MNETLKEFARATRLAAMSALLVAGMGGCADQPPPRPVNSGATAYATGAEPPEPSAGSSMRQDLAAAAASTSADGPAPAARPAPPCEARRGSDGLRRAAVLRTLDGGLGHWLRNVDIDPKLEHGRFRGWIIRTLPEGDACYADLDLQAGDVVTRINGRPVERPEEASDIWDGLRTSTALVIDFMRAGRPRTLRFRIVEQ